MEVEDTVSSEDYEMVQTFDKEFEKNSNLTPTTSSLKQQQPVIATATATESARSSSNVSASVSKDVNTNGTASKNNNSLQDKTSSQSAANEEYISNIYKKKLN